MYLAATGLQLLHFSHDQRTLDRKVLGLGLAALCCHAVVAWQSSFAAGQANLGFYKVSALIFLVINLACIVALLWRPLQNLLVVLFPLSALSVLVSTFAPDTAPAQHVTTGMVLHISSSFLAYAVLTLAAIQAALVGVQDHQLRQRHTRGIIQILPPLQLMERMLFELLWVGVILLSVAIVSGVLFMEDVFAQHLVHKTVLTILAWLVFAVLLWGRSRLGWRSQTAVRYTFAGFALLMLAFFGSKLVLELLLQRG